MVNENRQSLLDEIEELEHSENGLDLKTVLYGLSVLIILTLFCAPKIYLSAAIYYVSAQTNTALDNYRSLKEENVHLRKKLELLRYSNEIGATLK